jgi:hypothetical protein
MGAELLNLREIELDKPECKKLADAITEVQKFYPMKVSAKTMAFVNLGVVAAGIYIPMGVQLKRRFDVDKTKRPGPVAVSDKTKQPTQQKNGQANVDLSQTSPSQIFGDQNGALD